MSRRVACTSASSPPGRSWRADCVWCAPHEFDGIEFGGIRRQEFAPHLGGVRREPSLDDHTAVRVAPIPDARDRRPDQPQQTPEKGADAAGIDARVERQPKETPDAIPAGRNRERRDHGHLLARAPPLMQDRRLRPRGAHVRRTSGVSSTPASSMKISAAPSASADAPGRASPARPLRRRRDAIRSVPKPTRPRPCSLRTAC